MNRAHLICHSHENGNPSFLIIAIESLIEQHIQVLFTNPQKILLQIGATHPIFSLYILKEDFSIFFSLFKMNRSKAWTLT